MNDRRCCIRTCCFNIVLAIVGALFTFGLGLLLGALFGPTLIDFVASIVVFLVVMLIMFIVLLILRACRRDEEDRCF